MLELSRGQKKRTKTKDRIKTENERDFIFFCMRRDTVSVSGGIRTPGPASVFQFSPSMHVREENQTPEIFMAVGLFLSIGAFVLEVVLGDLSVRV